MTDQEVTTSVPTGATPDQTPTLAEMLVMLREINDGMAEAREELAELQAEVSAKVRRLNTQVDALEGQ